MSRRGIGIKKAQKAAASGAQTQAAAVPPDLEKKLGLIAGLAAEIDQIHGALRESKHELVLLKRGNGSLSNSLADRTTDLSRLKADVERLSDTVAKDVAPFATRLHALPTTMDQFDRKLQALASWHESERHQLASQIDGKADKSVVAPIQRALVMVRQMLFESHGKCSAGRAQFRCLFCDGLQNELEGEVAKIPAAQLTPRPASGQPARHFVHGRSQRTLKENDEVRAAALQSPDATAPRRPTTAPSCRRR